MRYQKYFIVEDAEMLEACKKMREEHHAQMNKFFEYSERNGALAIQVGFHGELIGLRFPWGKHPDGFLKPKSAHEACYPMRGKKGVKWREEFKALGAIPPQLPYLEKWLKDMPWSLSYSFGESGKAYYNIGGFPHAIQVCWYSDNGVFLLVLPDVPRAIKVARAEHPDLKFEGDPESWKYPPGIREILSEEWDFMVAKHKKEKEGE